MPMRPVTLSNRLTHHHPLFRDHLYITGRMVCGNNHYGGETSSRQRSSTSCMGLHAWVIRQWLAIAMNRSQMLKDEQGSDTLLSLLPTGVVIWAFPRPKRKPKMSIRMSLYSYQKKLILSHQVSLTFQAWLQVAAMNMSFSQNQFHSLTENRLSENVRLLTKQRSLQSLLSLRIPFSIMKKRVLVRTWKNWIAKMITWRILLILIMRTLKILWLTTLIRTSWIICQTLMTMILVS